MEIEHGADTVWVSTSAYLVFMMVLGFALLETGLIRKKNHDGLLLQKILASLISALGWWIIGYNFAFGADQKGLIGWDRQLIATNGFKNLPYQVHWVFQWGFADMAVTIPAGCVAERFKFSGYLLYLLVLSTIIYPIPCHWIWGHEGWLRTLGARDFAGATAVHFIGGLSGFTTLLMMGPRIGRFFERRSLSEKRVQIKEKEIQKEFAPQNTGYVLMGTLFLWFGYYGFNCGSTLKTSGDQSLKIGVIALNTTIGSVGGALCCYFLSHFNRDSVRNQLIDTCKGVLAGLIAITGCCDVIDQWAALTIGIGSGFVFKFLSTLWKKLKLDDPADASSLHMGVGLYGTIVTAFFAHKDEQQGIFYGGGTLLGYQVIALFSIGLYVVVITCLFCLLMRLLDMFRVNEEEEFKGLDHYEDLVFDQEFIKINIWKNFRID